MVIVQNIIHSFLAFLFQRLSRSLCLQELGSFYIPFLPRAIYLSSFFAFHTAAKFFY